MANSTKTQSQRSATAPPPMVSSGTQVRGQLPAEPTAAARFRTSEAGRLWQERHFAAALSFLAQRSDATTLATARAYLEREAQAGLPADRGVAAAVMDAFLNDMMRGADKRRDTVAKALQLSHGVSYDQTLALAGALRSEFLASLLTLDDCVRELFLRDVRQFLPSSTALDRSTFQNIS